MMSIGDRAVDPSGELAGVARSKIVTAGQDRHARARGGRSFEHLVGQAATGMARHDDVGGIESSTVLNPAATNATRSENLGHASTSA